MMTEIEQATEALIAAIDAERHRLPRGDGAYEAERDLLALCENAKRLLHDRCRRIKQRRDRRSSPRWRPVSSSEEAAVQHQVIDAGYRALAARLHPDTGGSHEAMARLNQVRDRLKRV
jgi:hypothetical protein